MSFYNGSCMYILVSKLVLLGPTEIVCGPLQKDAARGKLQTEIEECSLDALELLLFGENFGAESHDTRLLRDVRRTPSVGVRRAQAELLEQDRLK